MSKSLNNAIYLSDSPAEVRRKVAGMFTDPNRIRADIPGRVEGNPVFVYHDTFNPNRAEVEDLKARYRSGKVGDVEVKAKLTVALNRFLSPIRERRAGFEAQKGLVDRIIVEGTERMRAEARKTLELARKAMGIGSVWNSIRRKAEETQKKVAAR
jgi:tryptophanyl-tRNA synthetase